MDKDLTQCNPISIPRILKKSSPHINVRIPSKPVPYYHNSSATMQLLLSGDIKSNLSPVNPTESNRNRKQSKSLLPLCHTIRNDALSVLKSHDPQRLIFYRCYLKEIPFFNTHNLLEKTILITDQTIQNNVHSESLETNRNHLVSHI